MLLPEQRRASSRSACSYPPLHFSWRGFFFVKIRAIQRQNEIDQPGTCRCRDIAPLGFSEIGFDGGFLYIFRPLAPFMALKKLSDVYQIRAHAAADSATAQLLTEQTTISTGLDSLRREVLAIWGVQHAHTTSDNALTQDRVTETLRAAIDGGANTASCRWGVRSFLSMHTNPSATLLIADPDTISVDVKAYEQSAFDTEKGAVGDGIAMIVSGDDSPAPLFDFNVPDLPIGYVTGSEMYFTQQVFVDGIAVAGNIGGYESSIKIFCQRMEADAALYAAILTGQN